MNNLYEQKYKEALGWMQKLYDGLHGATKEDAEHYFPELKYSGDEKIRKQILSFLKEFDCDHYRNLDFSSWIAWLEKQGEPQDKGEISDGYHTFNELYYYRMLYNASFFNMLPKEWVHKSKRHNDGEECFGGGWFIVMANLPTGQISNHYELKDWDLFQIPEKEVADKWDGHTPQEAADRLHKYLLEKQGKKKHAQEIESFEAEHGKYYYCIKDYFCGGIKQASKGDVVQALRGLPIMSLKDASEYFLPVNNVQNPAWSEEDEKIIETMCKEGDLRPSQMIWLKSIKNRIQPKQEWSEDDEVKINRIVACLKNLNVADNDILLKDVAWLKSLRPQNTWKPSDEQMEDLKYAINMVDKCCEDSLQSLYNELKKL